MSLHWIEGAAVEVDGEGDAVVLVHGLGGTSNNWTPLMGALARHRVIRPDLPGSGRSARVEGPLSIASFVDCIKAVCDRLEVRRAHLVGHSLGTIVCLHAAVRHPQLARSLALFGPLLAPPEAARPNIAARGRKARSEGVAGMQAIAEAIVQGATSSDTRAHRPVTVALVRESLMRQDPEGYARSCEALAQAQPVDLAAIKCPTLLVTGEDDAVAPPQSVRAIGDRVPGSRVVVYPRCGHWTTYERPEECARELRDFLAAAAR
ncbi:MAG: alpha/beta hydrolase [Pseudomonadota bacterium]|nr:alpha/beta hydrolase [Pseudomonadota bacterium]